eukprot:12307422-Alexandrium_andersonii.AAC.1
MLSHCDFGAPRSGAQKTLCQTVLAHVEVAVGRQLCVCLKGPPCEAHALKCVPVARLRGCT